MGIVGTFQCKCVPGVPDLYFAGVSPGTPLNHGEKILGPPSTPDKKLSANTHTHTHTHTTPLNFKTFQAFYTSFQMS